MIEKIKGKKNYKTKFSTISILKKKINKNIFKKNHKKTKNMKKKPYIQKIKVKKHCNSTILFPCHLGFLCNNG